AICPRCGAPLSGTTGHEALAQAIAEQRRSRSAPQSELPIAPRSSELRRSLTREERHRQALNVIEFFKQSGSPFILYLRDFLGGARQGVVKSHYYTPERQFTIDNRLLRQVSARLGVIFVQSAAEEALWAEHGGTDLGPVGPSLSLSDDNW